MVRPKTPTPEQLPLLEQLQEAALLRNLAYRYYLAVFHRVVRAGIEPSLIARFTSTTIQSVVNTRNRLLAVPPDSEAPKDLDELLERLESGETPRRLAKRHFGRRSS